MHRTAAVLLGALGIADLAYVDFMVGPTVFGRESTPQSEVAAASMAGSFSRTTGPPQPPKPAVADPEAAEPEAVEPEAVEAEVLETPPKDIFEDFAAGADQAAEPRWVEVGRIPFAGVGQDDVTDLSLVAPILEALQDRPTAVIRLRGHTDTSGSRTFNRRLGDRRARAVAAVLVARGIDESRIRVESAGELEPVSRRNTATAHARNRRVEVLMEDR